MARSASASAELRRTARALKALGPVVRRDVASNVRSTMTLVWSRAVDARGTTPRARALTRGAEQIGGQNPLVLRAARSTAPLAGGLRPAESVWSFETGTKRPNRRATWSRRTRGTSGQVHGYPERQLEEFNRRGRVVLPAVAEVLPRIVSMVVQTVERKIVDALGVGRG